MLKNIKRLLYPCILIFFIHCSENSPVQPTFPTGPDTLLLAQEKVYYSGANWPWMNYGHDFGQASWTTGSWPHDGISSPAMYEKVNAQIDSLENSGIRYLRCFLLCDGRASPEFDSTGSAVSFDPFFFQDIDSLLSICAQHHIQLAVVILDYLWLNNAVLGSEGVKLGGHVDVITDSAKTAAFLENCLTPLATRYGRSTIITSWELMNEPEWRLPGFGGDYSTVSTAQLQHFFAACLATLHSCAAQPATLGSAKYSFLSVWNALDLDFYQVNCYEKTTDFAPFKNRKTLFGDKPVVIGEFPTAGTPIALTEYLNASWRNGYAGIFAWSINGTDASSGLSGALRVELGEWCRTHRF